MLDVLARPFHSPTDTLFVDAATGSPSWATICSRHLVEHRDLAGQRRRRRAPAPRTEYLRNLRRTGELAVDTLLTGHGRPVDSAAAGRGAAGRAPRRAARIAATVARAAERIPIAEQLWPARTVPSAAAVVWEVLGHLETLMSAAS